MRISQLHPLFVAAVGGVDLRQPLKPSQLDAIKAAQDRYAVLVLQGQPLSNEQLIAFGSAFGPLQNTALTGDPYNFIIKITNLDPMGAILPRADRFRAQMNANRLWHTDGTYAAVRPTLSMLCARIIPPAGGDTEFCDTRAAYEKLPIHRKIELDGLIATHSLLHSRSLTGFKDWTDAELKRFPPPVPRPLVHVHPGSGRKALYLASHIETIEGQAVPVGQALVKELIEFATQPQFVYRHQWSPGDLVIWDNRCTMHRLCPYDEFTQARDLVSVRVMDQSHDKAPVSQSAY